MRVVVSHVIVVGTVPHGLWQNERWHTLPQQVREELKRRLDVARKTEPTTPSHGDRS